MLTDKTWTRVLAMALVLPLAAACAETGEDDLEDTETLETTTTEMDRVELEPFGTEDINGWVTARTEGEEIVLTLNVDQARMGTTRDMPGTEGETSPEGEMGTDPGATGAETGMTGEGEMHYSARLIEGMCMDVRPGRDLDETATGETDATAEGEDVGAGLDRQDDVETVADFEEPENWTGTGTARPGAESSMSAHTLEARVERSEITDQAARSFAVVVEDDRMDETEGTDALEQDENSDVVACADVTRLIRNTGQPAGTTGQQPMGTEGTESGSEGSGSNY